MSTDFPSGVQGDNEWPLYSEKKAGSAAREKVRLKGHSNLDQITDATALAKNILKKSKYIWWNGINVINLYQQKNK
jgi:hypothetical protein